MSPGPKRIAVCICTLHRLQCLDRLLRSLAQQTFGVGDHPHVEIVVVDNDPREGARRTVEEHPLGRRWPLTYAVERRPGIPQARNRCLANVRPDIDFACFVDDDETVNPDWLDRLISAQQAYDADVVAGRVLPVLPPDAPAWVRKGRLLVWARHRTGETISEAATNNVLFRLDFVRRHRIRFNEEMALTGGTDKLFFQEMRSRGARMVWCEEAVAHERIPARRVRPSWFVQRGFRVGTTDARIAKLTKGVPRGTVRAVWLGASRVAYALLTLPIYLVLGRAPFVYNVSRMAYGVGCLMGTIGWTYDEYAPMHRRAVPPGTSE